MGSEREAKKDAPASPAAPASAAARPASPALFKQLVSFFATTIGEDKAARLIRDELREMGIGGDAVDEPTLRTVLAKLAQQSGIVGVTARVAVTQRSRIRATGKLQAFPIEPPRTGVYRRATPTGTATEGDAVDAEAGSVHPEDIAAAFGTSLDPTQALTLVRRYWLAARIPGNACSRERALALLEEMRAEAGQAGVAAAFAKARLHMKK